MEGHCLLLSYEPGSHSVGNITFKYAQDPISKITRAKWIGGEAQVVECLLYKYEALNSNPSPNKKKFFLTFSHLGGKRYEEIHKLVPVSLFFFFEWWELSQIT
jgi:hypothetical protein